MISYFDGFLLILLSGFVFYGLFFGLIRSFGSFVGVILGAILASRFYLIVSDIIEPIFFGYNNLGKVLTFLVLFTLVNRLTGLGFYLLEGAFKLISIIPFLKSINKLAGALFGFLTGSLSIGLVLYVISRYAILEHWLGKWLVNSKLAPMFLKINEIILPLLPEMLKKLKSLI